MAACGGEPQAAAPSTTTTDVGWTALTDLDPSDEVVEVKLVAEPAEVEILAGKTTAVWAYRDGGDPNAVASVPGPLLDARQGQRIVVHFDNQLPEDTTIHWHGLRLPAGMDGTLAAQQAIAPGETFSYEFVALDAGYFWFHPHVNGEKQIERGLYAPLLVRGGVEPDIATERVFVLDDVKIESSGALSEDTTQLDMMMGRQGNVLLVNGARDRELSCSAGSRERWRFVNSANGRFFNLELPGHSFTVIGWDGGMLPAPYETDRLLIAPGERYDVLVELAGTLGDSLELLNLHYDRGHDLTDPGPKPIMTLHLDREAAAPLGALPSSWGTVAPIDVSGASERPIVLTEIMDDLDPAAEPQFFINGAQWPDTPPIAQPLGTTEIWSIENDAEMDHPFHLHGTFFQLLDGPMAALGGNKDTLIVPQKTTLRVAVTFDAPGDWMYHCHILEHAERGMMGMLSVAP
jgi:FtsP/CotA-like multicopper oxidase with cupredoxin domain